MRFEADNHFATIPEWVLYHEQLSGNAVRLYGILIRHTDRGKHPGRATLAKLMGGKSRDTVDRAMKELETAGAVVVHSTKRDGETGRQTPLAANEYEVITADPSRKDAATPGRKDAATPSRESAATPSRKDAAVIQEQEKTREIERTPPTPPRSAFAEFWTAYPLKVGKRTAQAAWERATRRATVEEIRVGAEHYRDDPNREEGFTAHPTTWLNRDGWDDAPIPEKTRHMSAVDKAMHYAMEGDRHGTTNGDGAVREVARSLPRIASG